MTFSFPPSCALSGGLTVSPVWWGHGWWLVLPPGSLVSRTCSKSIFSPHFHGRRQHLLGWA